MRAHGDGNQHQENHRRERIDQVEFHPSYHALMEAACRHRLHGTPWSEGPGAHLERAAAFMLFTELEPSVLCPISMTYAVAPSLRANPAIALEIENKIRAAKGVATRGEDVAAG